MRSLAACGAIVILLVCFGALLIAAAQEPNGAPPAPAISGATYPNSPDGLKQFITDVFGAMESGDHEKASALISSLAIPADSAWFAESVGPTEAARFEARYEKLLPDTLSEIKRRFENALDGGKTEIKVRALSQSSNPIYTVSGLKPKEKYPMYIGDFTCVDGGFRFENEPSQDLSAASARRMSGGRDVRPPKIIQAVEPIYPEVAKAAHIMGVVVLHGIIGTDGRVTEFSIVSGNSLLIGSAFDAVRQWQYQPALLDGTPAEVGTMIPVVFQLPSPRTEW